MSLSLLTAAPERSCDVADRVELDPVVDPSTRGLVSLSVVGPGDGSDAAGRGVSPTGSRAHHRVPQGTDSWKTLLRVCYRFLRSMDLLEKKANGRFVSPGETLLDLWRIWISVDRPIITKDDFRRYRRLRRILGMTAEPHPDFALLAYIAYAGGGCGNRHLLTSTLGQYALKDAQIRIATMVGGGGKDRVPRRAGSVDDLLGLLPEQVRERFRAYLSPVRYPPLPAVDKLHIGRVMRLRGSHLRILGVMQLIGPHVDKRTLGTRGVLISQLERWDSIIPVDGGGSADVITTALDDFAAGVTRPVDTLDARLKASVCYSSALNASIGLAKLVLKEEASLVTDLLPARHTNEAAFNSALRIRLKALRQGARTVRVSTVTNVMAQLMAMQVGIENRVHQLEQILSNCMDAIGGARDLLDRGLRAGFEYCGPVVRADGSLDVGDQVCSFRFEFEETLFARASENDPDNRLLRTYLPRREGDLGGFTGYRHKPALSRRIHVVYERTEATVEGGECVEPFFADLFRWGLLETEYGLPGAVAAERKIRLASMKLPHIITQVEGLMTNPKSKRPLARFARGPNPHEGDIIVPLIEFYHAMAYARIIGRYGCRWGARFGEILQFRLGPDCFRRHRVNGKWKPYLALKPKNWTGEGKFGLDAGTAKAIRRVKEFTSRRFYRNILDEKGQPTLPEVAYGNSARRDLAPARYLFQSLDRNGGPRALRPSELLMFVRVLLIGIVDMRTHDGRYAFATALGLDGSNYDQIGYLLHHTRKSAMPQNYDLSALMLSDDAAERFNQRVEAEMVGKAGND